MNQTAKESTAAFSSNQNPCKTKKSDAQAPAPPEPPKKPVEEEVDEEEHKHRHKPLVAIPGVNSQPFLAIPRDRIQPANSMVTVVTCLLKRIVHSKRRLTSAREISS